MNPSHVMTDTNTSSTLTLEMSL